jgi:hypothetical protein
VVDRAERSKAERIRRGTTVRVTAPSFVAALVIYRGDIVDCAPILRKWVGYRGASEALDVFRRKGWIVDVLTKEAILMAEMRWTHNDVSEVIPADVAKGATEQEVRRLTIELGKARHTTDTLAAAVQAYHTDTRLHKKTFRLCPFEICQIARTWQVARKKG